MPRQEDLRSLAGFCVDAAGELDERLKNSNWERALVSARDLARDAAKCVQRLTIVCELQEQGFAIAEVDRALVARNGHGTLRAEPNGF